MNARLPLIFLIIAAVLAGSIYALGIKKPEFDTTALQVANVIMLAVSLAGWAMMKRNIAERPQAFVRGVYGTTMLRLFVSIIGVLSYALMKKPHVHKPTLFLMFGIWAVYAFIETSVFSKAARKQ